MRSRLATAALAVASIAGLAACGGADVAGEAGGRVEVVAAFYALEFAAERVGGDRVSVSGLTKPGVEPHDLELTARQVARVSQADVVLYLEGFQSAVDEAVASQAADAAVDVSGPARLTVPATGSHAEESAEEHADHAEGAPDPHFWLDPLRYADVGDALAQQLTRRDPSGAAGYRDRAKAFRQELEALDGEFKAGLTRCDSRELVTSHTAFGYLAEAYDLHQQGITGLSPESEPDPASLARIARFVEDEGVTTIYAETLVSRAVAETLARETGASLAVLDPLEGLTDESAGDDYFAVMRSNLETLRTGQGCS